MSAIHVHRPLLLVADDEPDIREMLVFFLEQAGFRVLEAENGQCAVELAMQHDILLALMDVTMPVLDGLLAATAIRQLKPGVAVVFHSAMPEDYVRRRFVGAAGYLQKPSEQSSILEEVNRWMPASEP